MGRGRARLRFLIDLLDDSDDWFTSSHSASVRHSREGCRRMSGAITALRGGRTWWAHFEFTRINIAPIILRKKIEEQLMLAPVFPLPCTARSGGLNSSRS